MFSIYLASRTVDQALQLDFSIALEMTGRGGDRAGQLSFPPLCGYRSIFKHVRINLAAAGNNCCGEVYLLMTEMTQKELGMISDALAAEALNCKKARMYSKTLIDCDLAACMAQIAEGHEQRYLYLLKLLGGN